MTELNPDTPDFQKQYNPLAGFSTENILALSEKERERALEHPEERAARLSNETKKLDAQLEQQRIDATFNRLKELGLLIILIAVLGFSVFVCF